jgi:hypothetical protein
MSVQQNVSIAGLVGALAAAFPHATITKETLKVYVQALSDIEPGVLAAAVNQCLAESEFFPTVAKIRQMCLALTSDVTRQPSGLEAWGEVLRQIGSVGYYAKPSFSSALVAKAVESIGWQSLCLSENQPADRAHFCKVYEALLRRAEEDLKWLPASRVLIEQVEEAKRVRQLARSQESDSEGERTGPTSEFMDALGKFAESRSMPEVESEGPEN